MTPPCKVILHGLQSRHNLLKVMDLKNTMDAAAVVGGVGSWFSLLPDIAALFTIVWLSLRIWESATVKKWMGRD